MKYVNIIIIIILIPLYILFAYGTYFKEESLKKDIFNQLITIDITLISFLIALIGIIAAIRHIEYINDFFNENYDYFKSFYILSLTLGSFSIVCYFLLISKAYLYNYIVTYLITFFIEFLFLLFCFLNVWNLFQMIFDKDEKKNNNFKIF